MNYKTMLMATAAVMISSQAMAQDLTNPFFVPGEGQFTSDTIFSHERNKAKHGVEAEDATFLREVLEYGVTDKFTVLGSIANEFDGEFGGEGEFNNSHNFDYTIGAKYTTKLCDKSTFQVSGYYNTSNPKDYWGKHTPERWEKSWGADFKLGYDLGDGLSAYGIYGFETDIDTADRELWQSLTFGLHKYTGQWALDGSVRYEFDTDGKNTNEWWLNAQADYYVRDNVTLGVYGSYFLDGTGSRDVDYNYEAGLRVKVLF